MGLRTVVLLRVPASERPPELDGQRLQDRVLVRRGSAAAAPGEGGSGPALRVGGLKQLAHEAEAGLADVGASGEHVQDGVDGAAEVGEGGDIGTSCAGGLDH